MAEEMSDLQKFEDPRELDLNYAVDGEENADGYNQIDLNMQQGSPSVPANSRYQNPIPSYCKSSATEFYQDDARRTKIYYDKERRVFVQKQSYQGEMDELPGSYLHKSSFEFKAQTFHHERGTEDSAHSQESPLTTEDNQMEEVGGSSKIHRPNTNPQYEKVKDVLLEKSQFEFIAPTYNEIEGDGTERQERESSSYSRSPLVDGKVEQKNEKYHCSRNPPAESRRLDMPHSIPHSPGGGRRRSTPPVTVKPILVSPQGFPHVYQSPNGHRPLPLQGAQDKFHSPIPHRQRHSSLPERSDLANRISSYRHVSPSATRTSVSPKRSQQGYYHKNGTSLKHMSRSPEPCHSLKKHGRHKRSISRSPIRRRDPVSGYGREYHDRSRSRSPYIRDHYRSPRRRHSPRQRSPSGYHSCLHSPRRRPWSPPPNRKTGLGKPGKNLFVAGFSFLTTERDLERKFSRFGHVTDVCIVREKRSGDSRGFGFLSLERDEDADATIKSLDETEWNGRIILAEKSKSTR